jgi:hypothetical protein
MSNRRSTPPRAPLQHREALARAMRIDRAYFAQHPGATRYIRPYIPAELPSGAGCEVAAGARVEVQAIGPRIRWRRVGVYGVFDFDP